MPAKSKTIALPSQIEESDDFRNLVDLLAVLGEATDQLNDLETLLNQDQRALVDEHRSDYTELQQTITEVKTSIEVICRRHPEWFIKPKTLKTPYGTCSFRESRSLETPSEDATITLIKAAGRAGDFIRTTEELDLEALEKLDDAELARFGIRREVAESFTAKPAKLDLGKAVAESEVQAA